MNATIPFTRLLRVEWYKATDTRAARWLLLVTGVSTVAIMIAPIVSRSPRDQTYSHYLTFPGLTLQLLLPIIAILTVTSEWSQRTVLTTFTLEPRRQRVIGAKVVVSFLLGACGVALAGLATAIAVVVANAIGHHVRADLTTAQVVGFIAFVLLSVLLGAAIGVLLCNTPAAIVAYVALPPLLGVLAVSIGGKGWISTAQSFNWILNGEFAGHWAPIAASIGLFVVAPMIAGTARIVRRDIG